MNSPPPIRREQSHGGKIPRNIVAPYQQKKNVIQSGASDQASSAATSATSQLSHLMNPVEQQQEMLDFNDFKFQPLDPSRQVTFDKYCGPTPESNWVIPNVLLVGAYPASQVCMAYVCVGLCERDHIN